MTLPKYTTAPKKMTSPKIMLSADILFTKDISLIVHVSVYTRFLSILFLPKNYKKELYLQLTRGLIDRFRLILGLDRRMNGNGKFHGWANR